MKEPTIRITNDDAPPEPNFTLLSLLRDGEKFRPGDSRGTLADRLGGEVQGFLATQMRVAKHRRTAVKGTITITINVTSGPDGSHMPAVDIKTKEARIPPKAFVVFADEEGELTGRPVEPLTERMYENEKAKGDKGDAPEKAGPKVGAASKL